MKEYGEVYENVDLKKYNTYGVGGTAKYLILPNSIDNLIKLIEHLKIENIKYFILGNGSNVILPDEDYNGVIIKLEKIQDITFKEKTCVVESGLMLNKLVQETLNKGYTNLYFLMGIPGFVGASLIGNAGAYGHSICEYVESVTILTEDGNIEDITNFEFGYRTTEFKDKNVIILKVEFNLEKGNVEETRELIKENLLKRQISQPLEYKNAGSVFKNPEGESAGKLIEEAGLKGKTVGGVMISKKHANFIVNFNNATSSDIITLINEVKKIIKEKYNIDLELEQRIIKW